MAQNNKFEIHKGVFQTRYKPNLGFYNQMYDHSKLFSKFNNWETDRLRLTLRNYEEKESFVIDYKSIGYETDDFKISKIRDSSELIIKYFEEFNAHQSISRLGFRTWALCSVKMHFQELVEILKLKILNNEFLKVNNTDTTDLSITLNGKKDGLSYRLMIGPMRDFEVPNFIHFNIENHIDPNSFDKYSKIASIHESYPKVAFYMDLDIFETFDSSAKIPDNAVADFQKKSEKVLDTTSKEILKHIFEHKI